MSQSETELSLSAKGLQRLEDGHIKKDFAFIVGGERYCCPCLIAEFLSPRVASERSQDITIQEFSLETEDPDHYFPILLSLAYGRKVSVNSEAKTFIRSVSAELLNGELFESTFERAGKIEGAELKARLEFWSRTNGNCNCESEVPVVASHFYEFSVSDFDDLSPSLLRVILSDEALVLRDEDSLFEVVHRLSSKDLS
jgi:hypothetical protein